MIRPLVQSQECQRTLLSTVANVGIKLTQIDVSTAFFMVAWMKQFICNNLRAMGINLGKFSSEEKSICLNQRVTFCSVYRHSSALEEARGHVD